jgi:hypothetical protein
MARFSDLLQRSQKQSARIFGSVNEATDGAWFGTTANAAPTARTGFSVAVEDVTKGPPRITRDTLSGVVNTPAGTIRISFPVASLTFVPVSMDTVCIVGATRAAGLCYRVTAVESAGGLYELELREEAQYLT